MLTNQEKKVLDLVKIRLGAKKDEFEDIVTLLEIFVGEIGNRIKHYINQNNIPEGLNYIWSSMVIDLFRLENPNHELNEDSKVDDVSLVQVGDTSMKIGSNNKDITNRSKSQIESVVANYKIDLNHYRKMRW